MTHSASFVASLCLEFDKEASTPLFRQLYAGLRTAILAGRLEGGTRLPPTRTLAEELHVSRNTVVNAFEQLIAEGYLEGRIGAGTYVAHVLPEEMLQVRTKTNGPPTQIAEHSRSISKWGATLPNSIIRPVRYADTVRAFQPGIPALDMFPYELWSKLAARCWRSPDANLLGYGHDQGYKPLCETIASYLKAVRGMKCEPEQVIITTGTQQALDLAARILLDPGDTACIEDPGYLGARVTLIGAGAKLMPIEVDKDGLNVEALKMQGNNARLVYVTPSHQYPLGVTMSLARRLALLEWATRTGTWLLEDDYDSEYRYEGRPLSSLQGLDQSGCVIYMGTFSKVLLPALRLGYMVVPPTLVETFVKGRTTMDRQIPAMDQVILTEFINEGHFTRHIRRMKGIYLERQTTLIEAARRKLAGLLDIQSSPSGLHTIGWLHKGVNDMQVFQQAQLQGIDTLPLSAHTLNPQSANGLLFQRATPLSRLAALSSSATNGLMFGYACVNPQAIHVAVERLAVALENVCLQESL